MGKYFIAGENCRVHVIKVFNELKKFKQEHKEVVLYEKEGLNKVIDAVHSTNKLGVMLCSFGVAALACSKGVGVVPQLNIFTTITNVAFAAIKKDYFRVLQ